MKEKVNQMFKDKLFLVMLVLGLLTIVAAAGVVTVQRGKGAEENPYLEMPNPELIAQEEDELQVAGASDAAKKPEDEAKAPVQVAENNPNQGNDLAAEAGAGKDAAQALVLDFADTSTLAWPVRQCAPGLQHGPDYLFPHPGPVQVQSRPGDPVRGQHPG